MSSGFQIKELVSRPPQALVEAFRGLPVANIADEMYRMSCVDADIRPFNRTPLVGTAVTVKAPDADNLMFHKALDLAQPGDVIVVTSISRAKRALCGEIMMRYARSRGLAGFVIDGYIRDVEGAEALEGFSVYARGVTPLGPYKEGPGEINVPIAVGGQVVCPGDILVGDADGLVVIRPEEAELVLEKARQHLLNEEKTMEGIAAGRGMEHGWVDAILQAKGLTPER